jgi:signal transduction histidine kinase
MATAHGPMLVVAKPILKSDRTGPTTGSLVMGRLLDQAAIQRVAAQAKLQVSVSQAETGLQAAEARTDGRSGLRYTPIHLHEQPDVLQASTTLLDLFGKPILSIAVDTPRAISGRGQAAVGWALASIAAAGLTVMGVLLWLLYRTVLQPVARLTEHAVRVGEKGDLRYRLALDRNDEVGVLAREFDRMTERLGETRRQLIDQSYRSGIAEMASGVLHNIGNAITPLTVRVSNLQEELGQAPLAEMGRAMAELDDPTVPAERREDLLRFVGLAGGELAEAVKSTRSQLTAFSHQLGRIQQILADQERFSRSARVVEPIDLAELVADSAEMLGPDMRAAMTVEIDESVRGIGDVLTARAALQQVIVNLLVNAAESILQAGRDNGRLVVRAEPQIGAGMPMAHVRFEDNGGGIAPEHLKRIFERGFSTKKIASGQGLHWSANTVASLQGELYAESMGIGRGAVLHLKIPFALETPVRAMAVGV